MKVLRCFLRLMFLCAAAGWPALAQCPPHTSVADTIFNADGSPAEGRVVIAWNTFQAGSCQVVAGQVSVPLVAGALAVPLYPNDAATPAGTSYRVTYHLKSGRITTEYWVVPSSATPVPLALVRSLSVPAPAVMVSQAQVTNLVTDLARKVELPSPCPAGKFLQASGSASPPQVSCVDGIGAPLATATQSGTVKTDVSEADPLVYTKATTDSLLAGKAAASHSHSAANITSGIFDPARLPSPTATTLGGVTSGSCTGTDKISGISAAGAIQCAPDQTGGGSQHQIDGTNLAANDPINFQNTTTIAFTNPSAGNVQAAVKDGSVTAAKLAASNPSAAQLSGVDDDNIASGALSPNRIAGTAEVQSNKGAANGYASLNGSSLVVQNPANAQATPAASKIPLADGAGKLDDGWLSSNVSLLGPSVSLASEVTGTLPLANGGTNQTSWTANRCVRVNSAGTALEAHSADCGSGGGAPGGSGTELQYRVDASTFGGAAGTTWDNTNRKLTWAQGTITSSQPFLAHSVTWNSGATTFHNLDTSLTDTASANGSTLQRWQVGGVTRFALEKESGDWAFIKRPASGSARVTSEWAGQTYFGKYFGSGTYGIHSHSATADAMAFQFWLSSSDGGATGTYGVLGGGTGGRAFYWRNVSTATGRVGIGDCDHGAVSGASTLVVLCNVTSGQPMSVQIRSGPSQGTTPLLTFRNNADSSTLSEVGSSGQFHGPFFAAISGTVADAGLLRGANNSAIVAARNAGNTANATLTLNGSDRWATSGGHQWTTDSLVTGTITNSRCLRVDGSGNIVTHSSDCGSGGGASTFTDLTDTPSSYSGAGGNLVRVNSGASALEFSASVPLVARLTADTAGSTNNNLVSTGMSFPIAANGVYTLDCQILFTVSATSGVGLTLGVNGPGTPTQVSLMRWLNTTVTANRIDSSTGAAWGAKIGTTATTVTSLSRAHLTGLIENGSTAGTLDIQFANIGTTGTTVVKRGSWCKLQKD